MDTTKKIATAILDRITATGEDVQTAAGAVAWKAERDLRDLGWDAQERTAIFASIAWVAAEIEKARAALVAA